MELKKFSHFETSSDFYSGYRLLATTDKNGDKPEIYIAASNRSAGKTTFFNGYMLHNFLRKSRKFLLLYRRRYEISQAADGFFKDISNLFFPDLAMTQEPGVKNVFEKLYVSEKKEHAPKYECGYATSLSAAEQIKKFSHLLSDVDIILFDEAFPENDVYIKSEIDLFMSIHDSLARGRGKMSRYLPVVIVGNLISVYNPYFDALGIIDTLQLDANYTRGDGFVIEQNFNEISARRHKESAFHRALSSAAYNAATQERRYINTSYDMIDNRVADTGRYIITIRYRDSLYSVRYNEQGRFYYISDTPDPRYKMQHAATEKDITEDAIFDPSSIYRKMIRDRYRKNLVKFRTLKCKDAAIHFIAAK